MSIVTFWNGTKEQVGTSSGAIAFAVNSALQHNIKILLLSTSFNDFFMRDCFWRENDKKEIIKISKDAKNGKEGLERLMRSNKISPERITQYTKILLKDRLEVLLGVYRRPK